MLFAYGLIELLDSLGVPCFSGLHVPVGEDWKIFMLRLHTKDVEGHNTRNKKAKCKVLLVVLTRALFRSKPCLHEIYTAIVKRTDKQTAQEHWIQYSMDDLSVITEKAVRGKMKPEVKNL